MTDKVNPIQAQKFLSGVSYPMSKGDIVKQAESQGADESILSVLKRIPDRQYDGPNAVSHEISQAQQ